MNNFEPTEYKLVSVKSGKEIAEGGWTLESAGEPDTLIRAQYAKKQIDVKDMSRGLFRFGDWLPMNRPIKGSSSPITFKSEKLAKHLGLNNLYITFNGYWPERGATMKTCSFKETEAYSVAARMRDDNKNVLVVASAGNTARAFARVCSDNEIPLLLCVPEDNINALWFDKPLSQCVRLVVTKSGSDYTDAINLSNVVCALDGFFAEGGAKNVARRDGMATTTLSAVTTIGRIPDAYFQAVGSGTGAIAAWEAMQRLQADGRFGQNTMRLMVSQNEPFVPMHDAWQKRSRQLLPFNEDEARKQAGQIVAKVLSNRKPPYSIIGGLFDALTATNGDTITITNDQAAQAAVLFEKLENIDITAAAAISTASLIKAVEQGLVKPDETIMLNITGGGEKLFRRDHEVFYLKPNHVFDIDTPKDEVERVIKSLF